MQHQGRTLCGPFRQAVPRLFGLHRARSFQASSALSENGALPSGTELASTPAPSCSASTSSSTSVGTTHLHSLVSARDGPNAFAVATVTFAAPAEEVAATAGAGAGPLLFAVQHAAQVALLAVRGALGCQQPPSAMVALPSMNLPRPAVTALAEALTAALGPDTPLVGCSSRLRLPDERRAVASADVGGGGAGGGPSTRPSGSSAPDAAAAAVKSGGDDGTPTRGSVLHVTLAAAHLPYHEVHAVRCETSSMPRLPYLSEALQGRRPPAFMLLAGADSMAAELLARLENLFPGSSIGTGIAARQLDGRGRRLVLVGPGGAAAGSTTAAGPSGRAERAGGTHGASPLPQSSEFEGHFQRMLLDRDGSAIAGSSSGNCSGAGSREGGGSGGGGGGSGNGRRRRLPPGPAAARRVEYGSDGGGGSERARQAAAAVGDGTDGNAPDAEAGSATAVLGISDPLPYIITGNQIHGGGGALLAIYPKKEAPSKSAAAAAGAAVAAVAATPAEAGGRRLAAASCDLAARLALGMDHLNHVALWGSALAAVSPPATGPEPAAAYPPAPDNPFYWWPAAVPLPGCTTMDPDPTRPHHHAAAAAAPSASVHHLRDPAQPPPPLQQQQPQEPATRNPDLDPDPVLSPGPALGGLQREWHHKGGKEAAGQGEDDDEDEAASAALAALSSDLSGLPLFPLQGVILFPGQTIQLRLFEKRYRLLARACLQQGAAFGLCWRGMGTTAVVRSYQAADDGGSGDVVVLLEGGVRFSYGTEALGVLPASYGINVASRAEYVVDDPPASQEDAAALTSAAHAVLDHIAGALEEAQAPSVQQAARTFANALHFASSSISSTSGPSGGAISTASAAPSSPQLRHPPPPQGSDGSSSSSGSRGGDAVSDDDGGGNGGGKSAAALLAADLAEAKRVMDSETASLLSLYLAPHIPVHLESLRREWFSSRSALWRLQQEEAWLRSSPRVAMATAASVLRLSREHPLRLMMGLGRVAPVGGAGQAA